MYLIVGLGNPENEYSKTRHNMGFNVINKIAKEYNISLARTKFKAIYGDGEIEGKKVMLVKPQTYMNLSGESVVQFKNFYKIPDDELIVIYDDVDFEVGQIKVKKSGRANTHNGMKSVVNSIGTTNFPRVRIGIGNQNEMPLADYVLEELTNEELKELDKGVEKGAQAVIEILKNGIDISMNKFN